MIHIICFFFIVLIFLFYLKFSSIKSLGNGRDKPTITLLLIACLSNVSPCCAATNIILLLRHRCIWNDPLKLDQINFACCCCSAALVGGNHSRKQPYSFGQRNWFFRYNSGFKVKQRNKQKKKTHTHTKQFRDRTKGAENEVRCVSNIKGDNRVCGALARCVYLFPMDFADSSY